MPPTRSPLLLAGRLPAALGLALGLGCSSSPEFCAAVQALATPAPPALPDSAGFGTLTLSYPNPPVIVAEVAIPAQAPQVGQADPALPTRFALSGGAQSLPAGPAPFSPVQPTDLLAVPAGGLPGGLSLDPGTGVIAGTATTPGLFLFTVTASNGARTASASLAYTVFPEGALVLSYPATAAFPVGTPIADQAPLVRNPTPGVATAFELLLPEFPKGFRLDPATGVISGTPVTPGVYSFTLRVNNGTRHAAVTLTYVVTPQEALALGYPPWPELRVGIPMATLSPVLSFPTPGLATSYAVTTGALPAGLELEASTGFIQGQPSTPGDYAFTVTARNGERSASALLACTVQP